MRPGRIRAGSSLQRKSFHVALFSKIQQQKPSPIDIVGGHEYNSGFGRRHPVQTIQQTAKRDPIQSFVGCFLLWRFVTWRKGSIDVFQQDNRLLRCDTVRREQKKIFFMNDQLCGRIQLSALRTYFSKWFRRSSVKPRSLRFSKQIPNSISPANAVMKLDLPQPGGPYSK